MQIIRFFYIISIIISILIYFKLKSFELDTKLSTLKTIILIPFFNVIILLMYLYRYKELE